MEDRDSMWLRLVLNAGPEVDNEELDRLTRRLADEFRDIDAQVTLGQSGPMPRGSKSFDAVQIGELIVKVLPVVIPQVVAIFQAWAQREPNRTVIIKMERGERSAEVTYDPQTTSPSDINKVIAKVATSLSDK